LTLTGERTLPGIPSENYWFRRHEAAYACLAPRLAGDRLLEVGSGEGYGAALLSDRFSSTLALDYDPAAMTHLRRRYPNLHAGRANLAALPVLAARIDAVVSLQVLEHVWVPTEFLAECHRVLRSDGTLVLSTPNRLTFSPGLARGAKPQNPFHIREFDAEELVALVTATGFEVVELLGLHAGARLRALDSRFAGGLIAAQLADPAPSWSTELQRAVESVAVADFTVSAEGIDTSLDLIVLARPR